MPLSVSQEEFDRIRATLAPPVKMTPEEIAENKKRSLELAQAVCDNLNRNVLAEHAEDEARKSRVSGKEK